ncbi:sigma-70 family RNA polymerase sigma factor [Niveispirillum irakense]|uniref:sigma-70 family RNA polymerase sigma factor n=1 Tax=Niveispirillum irakense TaxID=34011 RepID=UPI000552FE68
MQASAAGVDIGCLYASHAAWLNAWLRRHIRCPQRAADLTQDTFCRLLERSDCRTLVTPRTYLATIARHLIIDDARRAKIENAFLAAHAALMDGVSHPGPDQIAEAVNALLAVTRALDALPDHIRRAYLLSRLEGWSHGEIAAELGVSKSMVKQYVAKAYARCYAASYGPSENPG